MYDDIYKNYIWRYIEDMWWNKTINRKYLTVKEKYMTIFYLQKITVQYNAITFFKN